MTDLAGDPWTVQSTSLVAGNRLLHGQLLEVIGEAMPDQFADRDLGSRERTNSKETHP